MCVFRKAPRDEFLSPSPPKERTCQFLPAETCLTKFMPATSPQTEGQAARGCHRLLTLCSEMWAWVSEQEHGHPVVPSASLLCTPSTCTQALRVAHSHAQRDAHTETQTRRTPTNLHRPTLTPYVLPHCEWEGRITRKMLHSISA